MYEGDMVKASPYRREEDDDMPDRHEDGVEHMLEKLQIECDRFEKLVAAYEARLRPILQPDFSENKVSGGINEPSRDTQSPMANTLEDRVRQLRVAGNRIEVIMRRIDF